MARRQFDHTGYPCEVSDLSGDVWFYVQREGIVLCGRSRGGDPVEQAIIPWRTVKRALADHEKAKSRKVTNGDRA